MTNPVAYYQHRQAPADGLAGEDSRGVQVIVQDHPDVGAEVVTGGDYYVRVDGRWKAVDIFGLFDCLMDDPDYAFGRTITRDEYQAAMRRALAERNRRKNGWLPTERHG